ncbi:uncharacterized protein G2W53_043399 [Senna tora]|uniref:Uncharacterized protein n=1 Tax=Senna tora TaxID=362788 RepID=A0A834VZV7_9FABA|nr:uncharacterized protein G2W53_043399 [Senna tora]
MPQVEILVSARPAGSSDRKIVCETLADDDSKRSMTEESDRPHVNHPESPPESFWLSRDEEFDWWDRNAVYERKDSTKGTNSNSNSTNLNPSLRSNSQRISLNLKSKAAIIGLPKPQKPSFVDCKNRRNHKPGNTRLFPKRSSSVGGKSESSVIEPSSPKVSCMGRVRSRRDRNRRLRSRQRPSSDTSAAAKEKLVRSRSRKPGFFESFRAIFRCRRRENQAQKSDLPPEDSLPRRSQTTRARNSTASGTDDASFAESIPRNSVSDNEPPGLGGMKRFASGRRSGAWGVGDPEIHVAQ